MVFNKGRIALSRVTDRCRKGAVKWPAAPHSASASANGEVNRVPLSAIPVPLFSRKEARLHIRVLSGKAAVNFRLCTGTKFTANQGLTDIEREVQRLLRSTKSPSMN